MKHLLILATLLVSTSAFSARFPKVQGNIINESSVSHEDLYIVVRLFCTKPGGLADGAAPKLISEKRVKAKIDSNGKFKLKKKIGLFCKSLSPFKSKSFEILVGQEGESKEKEVEIESGRLESWYLSSRIERIKKSLKDLRLVDSECFKNQITVREIFEYTDETVIRDTPSCD